MAILAGLRTLLLEKTSIATLAAPKTIGGVVYPAVFVGSAVQGFSSDHVVIARTSLDPLKRFDGTTGMQSTDIDIECYGRSKTRVDAMADVITGYIKDYTGDAGDSDTINAVLWQDQYDTSSVPIDGTDNWLHSITIDVTIFHS